MDGGNLTMKITQPILSPAEQKELEARNAAVEQTAADLEFVAIMAGVEIPRDDAEQPTVNAEEEE